MAAQQRNNGPAASGRRDDNTSNSNDRGGRQGEEHRDDDDADALELPVHALTPGGCRFTLSLMRSRMAMRVQFVRSEDPP